MQIRIFAPQNRVRISPSCLTEALGCGDDVQKLKIDTVTPVSVKKSVAVCVSMQVEAQRPRSPEKVNVTVAHATVSKVDKTAEIPPVKQDIRQTVIAVQ